MDKDNIARMLAEAHHQQQNTITQIVRLLGSGEQETEGREPIKLLEVNPATFPSGIWPVAFTPEPPEIPVGSVIVEVTPAEHEDICAHRLVLPNGWTLGETLYPSVG